MSPGVLIKLNRSGAVRLFISWGFTSFKFVPLGSLDAKEDWMYLEKAAAWPVRKNT